MSNNRVMLNGLIHTMIEKIQHEIDHLFKITKSEKENRMRDTHNIDVLHDNIDRHEKILKGAFKVPDYNDDYEEPLP